MSLDCSTCKEKLSAYFDNQLSVAEKSEVEAHLRSCLSCRMLLEKIGRLEDLGRLSSLEFDAEFEENLALGIEKGIENLSSGEVGEESKPGKVIPLWHRYAAIAASVMFVILIGRMALEEAHKPLIKPQAVYNESATAGYMRSDRSAEAISEPGDEIKDVVLHSASKPEIDSNRKIDLPDISTEGDLEIELKNRAVIESGRKITILKAMPTPDSPTDSDPIIGIPKPVDETEMPKEDRGITRRPQQAASPKPMIILPQSPGISTISIASEKQISSEKKATTELPRQLSQKTAPIESKIGADEIRDDKIEWNRTGTVSVAPKPPSRLEEQYSIELAQYTASTKSKGASIEMTLESVATTGVRMKTEGAEDKDTEKVDALRAMIKSRQGEKSDNPQQQAVDLYIQLRAYYDLYQITSAENHLDYSIQLRDSLFNILSKSVRDDSSAGFESYREEVARLKLKRK